MVPVLLSLCALALLNFALSFNNWWPTPAIKPDLRLSSELVLLWIVLLACAQWRGRGGPASALARGDGANRTSLGVRVGINGVALVFVLLVIGRYLDVTAPALFGRPINLYWDAAQLPILLSVLARKLPLWQPVALLLAVALFLWLLFRLVRRAIRHLALDAAPRALRSRPALVLTACATVLSLANLAGLQATWPYVSKPVLSTYWRQAQLLLTTVSPERLARQLPASPRFDSDLAALGGRDVGLIFLESYGATAFDNPDSYKALAQSRSRLAASIQASGKQVVSAYVRSPTFGGASDLAHLGLLSGLDLSDPLRHDLLITTQRPTLIRQFRARGYQTYGFYPALSWDWPEKVFYDFDVFVDGPALGYRGPPIGPWRIPDQFSIARFEQMFPLKKESAPRFMFFATINSHFPFAPIPPYQRDWAQLQSETPYPMNALNESLAQKPDWLNLTAGYQRAIDYQYTWLGGYIEQTRVREQVLILLGDHQPVSSISGVDASWDVPVHLVISEGEILSRFIELGFRPGIEPRRPALGAMHELTSLLMNAFDSRYCAVQEQRCGRN